MVDTIELLAVITDRPIVLIANVPVVRDDAVRVEPNRDGANNVLPISVDAVVDVIDAVVP